MCRGDTMFSRIIKALHKRKNIKDLKEDVNYEVNNNFNWDAPCIASSQTEVVERIKKIKKNL